MPLFNDQQVDSFFHSFQKIAIMNDWPKSRWVALLQGVLTGTARKIYDSLTTEQSSNYDVVKDSILRAYECVSEFYR